MKIQTNLLNAGKVVMVIASLLLVGCATINQTQDKKPWRCAWLGWENIDNASALGKTENLLKYPIAKDADKDGFPNNYEIKNGKKEKLSIVEVDGQPALRFHSDEYTYVRIRSPYQNFKPNTKYVMKFQVKVKNLDAKKKTWPGSGLRVDIHNSNNIYNYTGIMGFKSSSNGWITVIRPFDTGKKPPLEKSRIMIFFFDVSGTILIRDIVIEKSDSEKYSDIPTYIMPDGRKIHQRVLKLK